jgi:glutamine amidotransferase
VGPFWELPVGRYRPVGKTDSEHMFCHLLSELAGRPGALAAETDWRWLHGKLTALNRQGRLNCLLSDGRRLFAYHDASGWKGLSLSKVYVRDHQSRRFEDATLTVDLHGEGVDHSVNQGFVVATQPLSSKGWYRFEASELLVMEDGMARFSTHRRC